MTSMLDSGKLTPEEYQNMAAVLHIRPLNQNLGYPVPARFNLLSGIQALIGNSRMICRHGQVRAETHGLQVLKAYQAHA
ncbi:hypothetical protein [Chromobacterium subtsugae]|uniref:hypothetical protein n=1 Tax=Chromobacterium subtsugae TaxID=251747 RepID=UPI0006417C60|nr:hypothetical protein [Chromobacterium subtsugae]